MLANYKVTDRCLFCKMIGRAVARPIIGGGGGGGGAYSYIRVLPDGFLLKAIVFTVCEHEYMNIHPPPQLSRLATAQMIGGMIIHRGYYFENVMRNKLTSSVIKHHVLCAQIVFCK